MIKRQTKLIIALLCAVAILIPVYFFVISPLVKKDKGEDDSPYELLPGEFWSVTKELHMMKEIPIKEIKQVIINNLQPEKDDSDTLVQQNLIITRSKDKEFYVKGFANAPIYSATLEDICRILASGTVISRVATDVQDFTPYGFKEDKTSDNWYQIEGKDVKHKVYIGNKVPDGRGHYVRYEGRDALYIQSLVITHYALFNVYDIMSPILTSPLNEQDYLPQRYTIAQKENLVVDIFLQNEEQLRASGSATRMRIKYPKDVDVSDYFIELLYRKFLNSLQGMNVVAVGKGERGNITALTPEELAEYGIYPNITEEMWKTIVEAYKDIFPPKKGETDEEYEKGIAEMYEGVGLYPHDGQCSAYTLSLIASLESGGLPNLLFFSEVKDGYYYVYSYNFDLVVKMPASTADFLEWDVTKYESASIFQTNIANIRRIEITSKDLSTVFDVSHKIIESDTETTKYYLTYSFTDPSGKLKKHTDVPDANGQVDEDEAELVANFRNLYVVFLKIFNQGLLNEDIDVTDKTPYLSIKFHLKYENGSEETRVINFYDYGTATRLKFQINGYGNSYVKKSKVDHYIECVKKVLNDTILDFDDYMGSN